MTARKMTPERLAEVRAALSVGGEPVGLLLGHHARDLLAHIDALEAKLAALVEAGGGVAASMGAAMIAGERLAQIGKWGPDHDRAHVRGEMAIAAAQLAAEGTDASVTDPHETLAWALVEKTRGDRVRQLVVAGALIAAEIDREAALRAARGEP